jgi:hypothetical protein
MASDRKFPGREIGWFLAGVLIARTDPEILRYVRREVKVTFSRAISAYVEKKMGDVFGHDDGDGVDDVGPGPEDEDA